MKKLLLSSFAFMLILSSCNFILGERIEGNGKIVTDNRTISSANKIKSEGFFDVELVNGSTPTVSVETDENILPYIMVENEGDWLIIGTKERVNLKPSHSIKVKITVNELNAVNLIGSGNIYSSSKLTSSAGTEVKLIGSGDINLSINTPATYSEITGSGNISLSGETKDASIKIIGAGDYKSADLKSENAKVNISGSGNVTVFADNKLEIHIAGSGNVYYKGKAAVEQHIAGSGTVKQIQ